MGAARADVGRLNLRLRHVSQGERGGAASPFSRSPSDTVFCLWLERTIGWQCSPMVKHNSAATQVAIEEETTVVATLLTALAVLVSALGGAVLKIRCECTRAVDALLVSCIVGLRA